MHMYTHTQTRWMDGTIYHTTGPNPRKLIKYALNNFYTRIEERVFKYTSGNFFYYRNSTFTKEKISDGIELMAEMCKLIY